MVGTKRFGVNQIQHLVRHFYTWCTLGIMSLMNIHGDPNKMVTIWQTTFCSVLQWTKIIAFWCKYNWKWAQFSNIGYENGLVPYMRQAITRRNDDSVHWHIYVSSSFSVLEIVECNYLPHIHLFIAMIYRFVKIINNYDIVSLQTLFFTYLDHSQIRCHCSHSHKGPLLLRCINLIPSMDK